MSDLEQALQALLRDPKQLAELSALASSLGFPPPEQTAESPPPSAPAPEPPRPPMPPPDRPPMPAMPPPPPRPPDPLARQKQLLSALKPFLKPSRQEKLDRALRAVQLSALASSAFRSGKP